MINRIPVTFKEGEIYEFGNSEPLYIYHSGELHIITPNEYNLCTVTIPEERWDRIREYRDWK